jgi:hypothetical protein
MFRKEICCLKDFDCSGSVRQPLAQPKRDSPDIDSMKEYGLVLSSYEDVKAQAGAIYARLEDGSMPCDGAWPDEQRGLFKRWMDDGMAP